jgi:hypothetical protein
VAGARGGPAGGAPRRAPPPPPHRPRWLGKEGSRLGAPTAGKKLAAAGAPAAGDMVGVYRSAAVGGAPTAVGAGGLERSVARKGVWRLWQEERREKKRLARYHIGNINPNSRL